MPGPCWCIRLEKPTIPLATQERLPRIYYTWYLSLRIRTTDASQLAKRNKEKNGKEMGAWGQEEEKVNIFWGVYWRVCHQNDSTWFFDDLQQYYGQLPIHPPKHRLPANYAIDSWLWLSRVSVLGAPVRCLLLALVWVKHAVCSMVSRQQDTRIRTSARTTYNSYRKCNNFFSLNMNIKLLIFTGQSDSCTTKLGNGTRTAL